MAATVALSAAVSSGRLRRSGQGECQNESMPSSCAARLEACGLRWQALITASSSTLLRTYHERAFCPTRWASSQTKLKIS